MPEKDTAASTRAKMPAFSDGDSTLTASDVAQMSGLSVRTLRDYRTNRGRRFGPPFHKVGRRVTYSMREVLDWLDSRGSRHD